MEILKWTKRKLKRHTVLMSLKTHNALNCRWQYMSRISSISELHVDIIDFFCGYYWLLILSRTLFQLSEITILTLGSTVNDLDILLTGCCRVCGTLFQFWLTVCSMQLSIHANLQDQVAKCRLSFHSIFHTWNGTIVTSPRKKKEFIWSTV